MTRWKNCYFPPYVYKHMCECLCGILCDPNHHHLFASSTTHRAMLWVDGGILSWASDNFSSCRQEGLLRGRDIWNTPTYMKNFYNSIPLRISIFQFFFLILSFFPGDHLVGWINFPKNLENILVSLSWIRTLDIWHRDEVCMKMYQYQGTLLKLDQKVDFSKVAFLLWCDMKKASQECSNCPQLFSNNKRRNA